MEEVELGRAEPAVDGRDHAADRRPALVEVLLQAQAEIIGQRLDGDAIGDAAGEDAGALRAREALDDADRQAGARLAGQLERADDGRRLGRSDEAVGLGIVLRRPADAAGIEEVVAGHIAVPAHQPEAEDVPALDEERPLLLVIGLEGGQVDDGRVGLDLAEVRIEGEIEGQVAGDADLAVQAAVERTGPAGGEGIARLGGEAPELADRIGEELDLARRLDPAEAAELAEERDPAGRVLGDVLPERALVLAEEAPGHLESPGGVRDSGEAELGEGDAHLGRPAVGADRGLDLPDGVPVEVGVVVPVAVVDGHGVALDPGGVDAEAEGGAVVVEAVDGHLDPVALDVVPTGHTPLDPVRLGVAGLDGDVQVRVVVEDLELRRLARGLSLVRLTLDEVAFPGNLVPGGIVDPAVDLGGMGIDVLRLVDLERGRRGRGGEDR